MEITEPGGSLATMWTDALLVGLGGFVGAAARFAAGSLVQRAGPTTFPWHTLAVNVVGCFLIGIIARPLILDEAASHGHRLFWVVGVLGGFTTFSAFGHETLHLLRDGNATYAALNVLVHVLLGLAAVWFGIVVGRSWS